MCSPRYALACPALSASLATDDAGTASRWLADVLATCPRGAGVSVLVDGRERGARVAARLMGLSERMIAQALECEFTLSAA